MGLDPDTLTRGFADLFAGRVDAYGKGGAQGGCVKEPLTYDHYRAHLDGTIPIGVYPQRDHGVVKWGCSDIDVEDFGLAYNLRAALNTLGITGWIELTRSAHYHVWVFCEQWTAAAVVRRAFLFAHQLARVPPREVNPKQSSLEGMQYGNYVRLPYPDGLHHMAPDRQVMLVAQARQGHVAIPLDDFLRQAWQRRTSLDTLQQVGSYYREPEHRRTVEFHTEGILPLGRDLTSRLNGLAWTVFQDGPLDGDRSAALFKLAAACEASGLSPDEALAVVQDADQRWGKHHARGDAATMLPKVVQRAYAVS